MSVINVVDPLNITHALKVNPSTSLLDFSLAAEKVILRYHNILDTKSTVPSSILINGRPVVNDTVMGDILGGNVRIFPYAMSVSTYSEYPVSHIWIRENEIYVFPI